MTESTSTPRKLLIRNAWIYTADEHDTAYEQGFVLMEDERIAAVGPSGDEPHRDSRVEVVDALGFMVLPGLVNAHWHETLAGPYEDRCDDSHIVPSPYCRGGDIEALSRTFGFIAKLPDIIGFDEGLAIARWSLWTQLRSGTTALGDIGSANNPLAVGRAAEQLGLRLRLSRWGSDIAMASDGSITPVADPDKQAEDWEAIASHYPAAGTQVAFMPSVVGAFGSSDRQLALLHDCAARHSSPYATHLAPLANERTACLAAFGLSPIARFAEFGLLRPQLMGIHTAHADEDEYRLLRDAEVTICQAPAHNALLGERTLSGTLQLSRFMADGQPFCTSTDGNVHWVGGMAEAMRASALFHNEANGDNSFLKPLTNLRHATIGGARALGWQDGIGSLEPGKSADITMIDCRDWRYRESRHPLEVFIHSGNSRDVDSVWVAGRRLLSAGQSTMWSEDELYRDYRAACAALRKRIGNTSR